MPPGNNDVVIKAEGLGKSYVLGHQAEREGYVALRDVLARNVKSFGRSVRDMATGRGMVAGDSREEFWALRDLDFEIKRGEVVGIIGRNGAGKSTLLKILSRITEPYTGRVEIHGRVASLLEVGTGFHPELTGRENVFLNGAILGMGRAEIKRKFDEIVAFAEVEKFLDTPVKRYSSGMYVRLAFAVAAHLEPEILVVDEVLAVGDVAFQRKCLGKMQNVASSGRTVLFVSHNLPAVVELTHTAIWLESGRLRAMGPSRDLAAEFLRLMHNSLNEMSGLDRFRQEHRLHDFVDITGVKICSQAPGRAQISVGQDLLLEVEILAHRHLEDGILNIIILNDRLEAVTSLASADVSFSYDLEAGTHRLCCVAPSLNLMPGNYFLTVGVAQKGGRLSWDVLETLPGFSIDASDSAVAFNWPDRPGVVLFDRCQWSVE